MRSERAGRVSRGGRRKSTAPPGSDIMRKKTACSVLPASMLRIHEGNSATAENVNPPAMTNASTASFFCFDSFLRFKSRKHFNLHLLRCDVVRDILGGDRQFVGAGNGLSGNEQIASIGGGFCIPSEFNRGRTFQARDQSAGALRCIDLQVYRLAALESFVVQLHFDYWRLARNHKCLGFAIRVPQPIAQDETYRVSSVLHIGGSEKARLPDVF